MESGEENLLAAPLRTGHQRSSARLRGPAFHKARNWNSKSENEIDPLGRRKTCAPHNKNVGPLEKTLVSLIMFQAKMRFGT
jgi:hypothetical protein